MVSPCLLGVLVVLPHDLLDDLWVSHNVHHLVNQLLSLYVLCSLLFLHWDPEDGVGRWWPGKMKPAECVFLPTASSVTMLLDLEGNLCNILANSANMGADCDECIDKVDQGFDVLLSERLVSFQLSEGFLQTFQRPLTLLVRV